ncbi:hypothetical protein CROQUDRAFT_35703 [Cronartium quercuum f. sp. fusiforme G11]|uniref:Expansin-like EG45 domain-containing protein n=1 Tax=Cronartium quercuum f. sp. fusiforme G11 TaxID=708437 RepID=A0A9P6NXA4_9BASI|nr:hypothetical protein CROQUDRAFT_35703 [Cronartium quercuum f. sp. fusiforme G11]
MLKSSSATSAEQSSSTKSFTNTLKTRELARPVLKEASSNEQGTFWQGATWIQGCLFQDWSQPKDLPYFAVATNLYQSGIYCGTCFQITSRDNQKSAIGIVNSECVDCPANAIDMSQDLYDKIMGTQPGRSGLSRFDWEVVPCPLPKDSKMLIIGKDGASKWYLSLQVANTFNTVINVEVEVEEKWYPIYRKRYNYWEFEEGEIRPSVVENANVRVTCSNGRVVTIPEVKIEAHKVVQAEGNC